MGRVTVVILATLLAVLAGPARAAEVILLGAGELVADGESTATVHIWSDVTSYDARVKVKPSLGKATVQGSQRNGITAVQLELPALDSPTELTLDVRIKGGSGEASETLRLRAVPPHRGPLAFSFEPEALKVGVDSGVLVRITLPEGPQQPAHRKLRLRASVGTVEDPVASGDGSFVARWTPPKRITGSMAVLFTAVDPAAPGEAVGVGTLPVLARRTLDFDVEPGSTNMLKVGSDEYGPKQASSAGKVSFEVVVDPRRPRGLLQTVGKTSQSVLLATQDVPRLAFVPVPDGAPADRGLPLQIHVAAMNMDSTPYGGTPPELRASGGTVTALTQSGQPGLFVATWTPPDAPGPVRFTSTLGDQTVEADLRMVDGLPTLTIEADPAELEQGARDVAYTATMAAPDGSPLTARAPELVVAGGTLTARPSHQGEGAWAFSARRHTRDEQMVAVAEGPAVATGLPPARLLVWPAESRLPTGSSHQTLVLVAAVDAFGNPVVDVPVSLEVVRGGGSVTPSARTNSRGLAKVAYDAGDDPTVGVIQARAAGLVAETSVLCSDDDNDPPAPPSGDPGTLAALERWREVAAVSLVRVKQPEPEPVAVALEAPASAVEGATPVASSAASSSGSSSTGAASSATGTGTAALAEDERASTAPPPKLEGPAVAQGGRVSFSLASVPHLYEADGSEFGRTDDSSFRNGDLLAGQPLGGLGGDIRALIWVKDLGLDLRFRGAQETVEPGGTEIQQFRWQAVVGGRARYRVTETFAVYGGLAGQRLDLSLYPWATSSQEEVERYVMNIFGGRVAVGFDTDLGPVFLEGELAETLVPYPVNTAGSLLVGVDTGPAVAVHLGLAIELRTYELDAWGDRLQIQEQEQALLLGATALLP